MHPANDLAQALERMRWRELEGRFGLLALPGSSIAPELGLVLANLPAPAQVVVEEHETSVLARSAAIEGLLELHPDAAHVGDLIWIRFEAPMGWDVVGFLAHVTGALARAGVPLGAVCSFQRDHLFVAAEHRLALRATLAQLFPEATPSP